MIYTKSEINELSFGQLTPEKLKQTIKAFNGFADLFGKAWLDKEFYGRKSAYLVLNVLSLWEDWSIVKGLSKSEEISKRWKSGIGELGVTSEIRVIAHLVSMQAKVELFPKVGNRVPDFRFEVDSHWVYGEISRRGISKVRRRGSKILERVSLAASRAIDGKHGKIAILRDLEDGEIEIVISWLNSLSRCREDSLNDIAVFRADDISSAMDRDDPLFKIVPEPRLCTTYISKLDNHTFLKGSACICISDRSAQEILKDEAAQLPQDNPGIVLLDISNVIGGCTEWYPLIQRRLQPNINTRISGVLLFEIILDRDGPMTEGCILINQHARNPIPEHAVTILQGMIGNKHRKLATQ